MNSFQGDKVFGTKLREARKNKNLTQLEVAQLAKLSVNYYACIERGEVNPSLEKIKNIVKALGLKSSDILPF
jgi:transcriptional regulator with XRE-family HTH domain